MASQLPSISPLSLKSTSPPGSYNASRDGYDIDDFVNPPAESCICPYCQKVLRSPHTIECGHRFCHGCLDKINASDKAICPVDGCKEPIDKDEIVKDHAARREIESLLVYCNSRTNGCKVTVKLKDLKKHQNECDYTLIDCIHKKRGCDTLIERRHLVAHLSTECLYAEVQCKYCGTSMPKEELNQHIKTCDMAPVSCPNECGNDNMKRGELEHHLQKCPLQQDVCSFSEYGCEFRGTCFKVQDHMSHSAGEHLIMVKNSHSKLEFKYAQLERRYTEMENQKGIVENRFKQQSEELDQTKQKVAYLEEKVTKLETQSNKLDEKVRDSHKIVAVQNDKMMRMEHDMTKTARKDDIEECKKLHLAVQETCRRVEQRVERLEYEQPAERSSSGGAHTADIEEIRKTLSQIGTQLGMHDVRLAEQDLRFQVLETACYDGVLIWKIKDFARRKHEAVIGKTLSLYSQPFYTSKYGYKMCARVYLNGDGMGKGTHMSLFFVVMRGDYDQLLTWPYRQKVTLVLMDQDTGRRNLSDTFRPDPTSSSFKRPTSDMNIASGCPLFVSQSVLETPTYVKNDTLFIKVIVDTSDLYGP
ncbi:TNF receptor-associated factor 3-like [Glandiceps talaboti]